MYRYLSQIGEVYLIEVGNDSQWMAIGDAALSHMMMPIVIGDPQWRGRGLGRQVLRELIDLAREKGIPRLTAHQIFHRNTARQQLFAGYGLTMSAQGVDSHGDAFGVWTLDLATDL